MQNAQHKTIRISEEEQAIDRRAADRHKLVLRVGLLEHDGRPIFCLVRNISSAGVQVKPYGRLIQGASASLRVGDEDPIAGTVVWSRDGLAGIEFDQPLNTQALLRIGQKMVAHRRRTAPRVATDLQACVRTGGKRHRATLCDISMSGARIRTAQPVTFGDKTAIEVPGLPSLIAYLRWSDGAEYGVSFQAALPMQIIADLLSGERIAQTASSSVTSEAKSISPKNQELRPASVVGPLGSALTLENLPTADARWTSRRKAEVLAAIEGGLLTMKEASERYSMGIEEFILWKRATETGGLHNLQVKRAANGRRSRRFGNLPA